MEIIKLKSAKKFDVGSVFFIQIEKDKYAFGRCLLKLSIGHLIEVFKYVSKTPQFDTTIEHERLLDPQIIDSFSLFSKKNKEGNWNVIGKSIDFEAKDITHLKYTYGTGNDRFLTDVFGNKEMISKEQALEFPVYSPKGNEYIVDLINKALRR